MEDLCAILTESTAGFRSKFERFGVLGEAPVPVLLPAPK